MFYRVWLTTALGASGSVDVSVDRWNEKDLAHDLAVEADNLDLAFHLKG